MAKLVPLLCVSVLSSVFVSSASVSSDETIRNDESY